MDIPESAGVETTNGNVARRLQDLSVTNKRQRLLIESMLSRKSCEFDRKHGHSAKFGLACTHAEKGKIYEKMKQKTAVPVIKH